MQCGHDCCRHWWWSGGLFSWSSVNWDKPVSCVISQPETQPNWNSVIKPPNFIPLQNSRLQLKKLLPYKAKVKNNHVVNVYGTGFSPKQMTDMIDEINEQSLAVVKWGRKQVMQKMMFAMTRVGLKVLGTGMPKPFLTSRTVW
jgi:hypothetical protein